MTLPRYQIFISSTFKDLQEERQSVLNAILKLNQFPAGMEIFPAVDDTAWGHIEKVIKDSDYYVLIIGGKYGSIEASSGISYTEKEYDYAVSQGIPVLAFTRSDEDSIPVGKVEMDPTVREKLKNFKQKVGNKHHWNYWKNLEELKANVISSLSMAFVMNPQKGWAKANGVDSTELLNRLAILQGKYDKLQIENEKLRNSSITNLQPNLSQGEDIIKFSVLVGLSKEVKITITWNQLFIEIAQILVSVSKAIEWELNHELADRLINNFSDSEVKLSNNGELSRGMADFISNQFVALDLIKIVFDRKDYKCWSLTEKGRKLFALKTAITQEDLSDL